MWQQAKKILCVRLDNLGDVLMTTPALRALRAFCPEAELTLLTSSMGAGIAAFIPEIQRVIPFDVPWVKNEQMADSQGVFDLVARLKSERFDAAVIFTVFSQNPLPAAMLAYLAGIPLRLGYCRENPYDLLTDWLPDQEPFAELQHEVIHQINLVRSIGADTPPDQHLSLNVPMDAGGAALHKTGIDPERRWLVMHPGASESRRQYPMGSYIEAARALAAQGFQIVVTGSTSERELAEQLAHAVGGVSMSGRLTLAELIGLIACAPVLISNNTGPVHIAAAVGTPVVVLYAHTNPQHTPWQVNNRVLYFDVPEVLRSKNTLLRYVYEKTVHQPVQDARPEEIVQAVGELLG